MNSKVKGPFTDLVNYFQILVRKLLKYNNWDSVALCRLFGSALGEVQTQSYSGKILYSIMS